MKLIYIAKYKTIYLGLLIFLIHVTLPLKISAEFNSIVEWEKKPDPLTGYQVWQITNHDSGSVGFYFERQAFTADDKYVLFTSNRSGSQQLYKANLISGDITQLTHLSGVQTGNMHPDGLHCLFQAGESLMQVNVSTNKIETLVSGKNKFPSFPRWSGSYSADGKLTTVSCKIENGTEMFLVDIPSGKIKPALKWNGAYSHPLINPKYPYLITFVPGPDTQNDMTLPQEKRARTWILDTRTGKAKQFLICPYGFRATHESWSTDGERFYFYKKSVPGWMPVSICSINKEGKDWQEYYTHKTIRLGHGISSPDGKWFVSDGQDPGKNPLLLLHLPTGKETFLCWPDASIAGGQYTHVHPSFSSSGKYVYFTSDRTGNPQVYVMKIPLD